jgi:asparagine synthase (glutamine-hydrolysing)
LCGIAGYTRSVSQPFAADQAIIRRLTANIHHRGPDQSGVYEDDHVALGAVRLRIIDLSSGNQPITSEDGDTTIVFNGEVYNHVALRQELEALGHKFQSHCDTEVVLEAFRAWDVASFAKLRGMFAFAIWQKRARRLVLVRDRMGIKPLYVREHRGQLHFGSELKAVIDFPGMPRELNRAALGYYLGLNWTPSPWTLVEDVRKLAPGTWLEWKHGHIAREERYWKHEVRSHGARPLEEAKEELDQLLREATREHLISDVPLGVWASGGLDSTTVLHYAAEQGQQLKTFSVSFTGRSFDESRWFREVATRYQCDHHEFDVNPETGLEDAIREMVHHADEPSADAGALPVWFLSRMCREHVTVALSGEGADELFAGYETYRANRYAGMARKTPAELRKLAGKAMRWWPSSDEKISLEYKARRFLQGTLMPEDEAHLFWNGAHDAEQRALLAPGLSAVRLSNLAQHIPGGESLNRMLWLDQQQYLVNDILNKCDRMSMAHSLEVRPVFLDHRIVEFANSLPEELKFDGRSTKRVLRELMKDKLPASVIKRPKQGFDIPTHGWFRGVLRPLLEETLSEKNIRETGLFDYQTITAMKADHAQRRASYGYHFWGLVIFMLWVKHWNISTQRAAA